LQAYNEHTNLVANSDADVVIRNHVLDALSLVRLLPDLERHQELVDIGSGAGFPGLILAMVLENVSVLLIDSVGKKTNFLSEAASMLGIEERVEVINDRAEEVSRHRDYREKFDLATARAVGKLDLTVELTLPFLKVGGLLLAQKSKAQLSDELEDGRHAASLLGGAVKSLDQLDSEVLGRELVVVCIEKQDRTPPKFPRPTPQLKKPLR
jgi:16S rRNA (guanine527-N7)-methyltransferase